MAASREHEIVRYQLGWKVFDYAKIKSGLNDLGRRGWEAVGTMLPTIGTNGTPDIVILLERAVPER
ncbi:hypothetical protein [Pseudonocardia alaniniphila]|uniref:DUF4177 domain-containing protein n=1 Tax=Pseudonocardia alaniniphila TaxID=75291 RepID=A0ABS9TUY0_9PSEU|nr:hypothetical protein [Pseudonocardia alaniniphila]MCH6172359.1 hypothetical protein [Pseudonocardia alaniniphila]